VLEAADHARRRGATPFAVVTGYGFASEAYSMVSPQPDGSGVSSAASQALGNEGKRVGWIKTHGTGTVANDAAECSGLAAVFGDRLREIPLTSLKPMLGHCLGACGAVEGVASILAFNEGFIPPTVGFEEQDPLLPPCTVMGERRETEAERILLLAESFGGRCAALSVEKPD
jgi:3-oxoacyl-[acyl-carrier-protein] synthase II